MAGKFFRINLIILVLIFGFGSVSWGEYLSDENLSAETQRLYYEAENYYVQGELNSAREAFLEILELDPKDKIAEEFLKAVCKDLKGLAEKNGLFVKHFNLGRKYFRRKKWPEAKKELTAAVEACPEHKDAARAISLWDKINRHIIRDIQKKAEKELSKKALRVQRQEEEIKKLKPEKKEKEASGTKVKEKKKVSAPAPDKKAKRKRPIVNLQGAIQIAVCNSLPVKIAKEQLALAKMKVFESWRALFPSVVGEISDIYGKTEEEAYESRKKSLRFQQLIFDGGRSVFRLHQAELAQKMTQENFSAVKQQLIFQVEQSYYKLIYLQKVVKAQKEFYEEVKKFLEMTKKQYKLGYVSRLEFLNFESQFNQAGFALVSSRQSLSLAKLKFQQVLNLEVPFALEIEGKLNYNPDLEISLDRCLKLALANRPQMRVAQLNLASSKYGEKIAKRKGWPELNVMGSIGESGEAYTTDVLRMKDEWSVLGRLNWSFGGSSLDYSYNREKVSPTEIMDTNLTTEARRHSLKFGVFDDLAYFSKGKAAEIVFYRAMNDYKELRQKIVMEIKESYFLYERAKIMLETVTSKIKYYKKETEIAELRKSLDIIPLSQLVESKIKLNEQKIIYDKALSDYYIALATLNRAMGISFYYGGKRL